MTAATADGMDRLAKSAHSGIDAASNAAHPVIDRIASGAHNAVGNADELATQAAGAIDSASVKGEQLFASGSSYMREHPLLTLGLAVTTGYLLSRLLASPR
ncbi:MAG: DUF883 domain-containing protein [Gammaproteobacteria bacterium]|nr:MAG: DUF883 domain-containing protein [Gammaproteobacteria bacterium]